MDVDSCFFLDQGAAILTIWEYIQKIEYTIVVLSNKAFVIILIKFWIR